jgi:hypothetical protein
MMNYLRIELHNEQPLIVQVTFVYRLARICMNKLVYKVPAAPRLMRKHAMVIHHRLLLL